MMYDDVLAFHEKFKVPISSIPRLLEPTVAAYRIAFLREELQEYIEAVRLDDVAAQADALVDLVYVALGTAIFQGLPWKELWDDVHAANMRKVRGIENEDALLLRSEYDVVKPADWRGPQTHRILLAASMRALRQREAKCTSNEPPV